MEDPNQSSQKSGRFRSEDSMSRQALEAVLRQTAALSAMTHNDEACQEVARRLAGMAFQWEPALELVRATLRKQGLFQSESLFDAISQRVAQALFDNPESHARLEAFWRQLTSGK